MKNTKLVILETALDLFNSEGLSKVTLRTIANKMNISQGNLNYHYKKREDIIEAIYFQLVEKIDQAMSNKQIHNVELGMLFGISSVIMDAFYEYRFFMLDFVQIMRESKTIKAHYSQLSTLREKQFLSMFQLFIEHKILREEILVDEYLHLYNRIQILGDFWISSAAIKESVLSKKLIPKYSKIISEAIYPYLTDIGKQQFSELTQPS